MLRVNENLKPGERSTIHKFELAGLGKAPYTFTGCTEKVFCVPGCPPRAGSSCDYCCTGIRYEFWLRSADGNVFKVGCDCIHKADDRGLVQQISAAERQLRDAKNKAAKERKKAREAERIASARDLLPAVAGKLSAEPHPNAYWADQGRTLLDYVHWCLENRAGIRAAGIIEHAAQ